MNVDRLTTLIFGQFIEQRSDYDANYFTDQSLRLLATETIREKVIESTDSELPYAVAVHIEEFLEEGRLVKIAASILVEKPGQKAIVIGRAGERLKGIGIAARVELEKLMACKVFLNLHVKIKEAWRDNDRLLIELGY